MKVMKANEKITATFSLTKNGWWTAWVEEIPGVTTQGKTLEEAKENLLDAMKLLFETRRDMHTEEDESIVKVIKEEIQFV